MPHRRVSFRRKLFLVLQAGTTCCKPSRERIVRLLSQFADIYAAVGNEIEGVSLALPTAATVPSLSSLKRYEDALDALVCGWVDAQYAQGNAIPYGDATAAVWVPRPGCPATTRPSLLRDTSV